mgnify:CR=1 FL=1
MFIVSEWTLLVTSSTSLHEQVCQIEENDKIYLHCGGITANNLVSKLDIEPVFNNSWENECENHSKM